MIVSDQTSPGTYLVLVLNQGCPPVHDDHTPGPSARSSTVLPSPDSHASGGCGECACPDACL